MAILVPTRVPRPCVGGFEHGPLEAARSLSTHSKLWLSTRRLAVLKHIVALCFCRNSIPNRTPAWISAMINCWLNLQWRSLPCIVTVPHVLVVDSSATCVQTAFHCSWLFKVSFMLQKQCFATATGYSLNRAGNSLVLPSLPDKKYPRLW